MEAFHHTFPLIRVLAAMYAAAVGTLWGALRLIAPAQYQFLLVRLVCSAFIMAKLGNDLQTMAGLWLGLLLKWALDVLIIKFGFQLKWMQGLTIGTVYCIMVAAVYYTFIHVFGTPAMTLPHKPVNLHI